MNIPSNHLEHAKHAFNLLEGTWTGEGRGSFPTIDSFEYRETLIFTRRNENSLLYEQRTDRRLQGQDGYVKSHWETGFLQILETGGIALNNAQIGGRNEVLIGTIETVDQIIRLHFASKGLMNDERMIASARTIEIHPNMLKYEMGMKTTRVDAMTTHLTATLHRMP
jgi:hypothetical protein